MLPIIGNWTMDLNQPEPPSCIFQQLYKKIYFNCPGLNQWDTLLLIYLVRLKKLCQSHHIILDLDQLPGDVRKLLVIATTAPQA